MTNRLFSIVQIATFSLKITNAHISSQCQNNLQLCHSKQSSRWSERSRQLSRESSDRSKGKWVIVANLLKWSVICVLPHSRLDLSPQSCRLYFHTPKKKAIQNTFFRWQHTQQVLTFKDEDTMQSLLDWTRSVSSKCCSFHPDALSGRAQLCIPEMVFGHIKYNVYYCT